ncbi:MAG TPA: hypothetical protein VFY10_02205 [Dehalococcoidia bacterium]|nr:hypothetical protein [Dehalococcoidia bacterium]
MQLGSPNARRDLAALFTTFCDGVEDAGMTRYAQIGRTVADELRRCADELDAERTARVTIQTARDRALALLADHAGRAVA